MLAAPLHRYESSEFAIKLSIITAHQNSFCLFNYVLFFLLPQYPISVGSFLCKSLGNFLVAGAIYRFDNRKEAKLFCHWHKKWILGTVWIKYEVNYHLSVIIFTFSDQNVWQTTIIWSYREPICYGNLVCFFSLSLSLLFSPLVWVGCDVIKTRYNKHFVVGMCLLFSHVHCACYLCQFQWFIIHCNSFDDHFRTMGFQSFQACKFFVVYRCFFFCTSHTEQEIDIEVNQYTILFIWSLCVCVLVLFFYSPGSEFLLAYISPIHSNLYHCFPYIRVMKFNYAI